MLITVSGVDCAGKSTQIEHLRQALDERGLRATVLWFRPGYSPELDALRALVRRARPGALPTTERPAERAEVFGRAGVRRAWVAAALVDTLFQYALKARARRLAGQAVICDRWLDDGLLDLVLRFPDLERPIRAAYAGIRAACPRPDHRLLLTIPYQEMLRRMEDKDEPFPDEPAVRGRRYDAYMRLAEDEDVEAIDGARPPAEVHRDVLAALGLEG